MLSFNAPFIAKACKKSIISRLLGTVNHEEVSKFSSVGRSDFTTSKFFLPVFILFTFTRVYLIIVIGGKVVLSVARVLYMQ
jgi:hypothetical protein